MANNWRRRAAAKLVTARAVAKGYFIDGIERSRRSLHFPHRSVQTVMSPQGGIKTFATLILLGSLGLGGCQFIGGAATGALASGAGYEINAKRQMDRLEDDYRRERISRREYEARRNQIERGSILY
jgi:hypothetical protein